MNDSCPCPFCKEPMTAGATPSHYERGECVVVGAAFDPVVKDKRGNKAGYVLKYNCSVSGCKNKVAVKSYCKEHQAAYMVGWRTGVKGGLARQAKAGRSG